ncbi:MAG: CYTH domain-containing protein [Sphaerochaetaceae bacterium]
MEIECKTRLSKEQAFALEHTIDHEFPHSHKSNLQTDDWYLCRNNDPSDTIRIRIQGTQTTVTRKEKKGFPIEINKEIEIIIKQGQQQTALDFFASLGYQLTIQKRKKGWQWKEGDLIIEVVEVSSLGWFLEIELLVLPEKASKIEGQKTLDQMRKRLGVFHLPLESRYYIHLLQEAEQNYGI